MKKQKLYIGLDVHKANSFFVAMDREGKIIQRSKVATSESELLRFIKDIKGKTSLAVEETPLTQWVYLLLRNEVDRLVVCDQAYRGKRYGAKTDFRDAADLADMLRINRVRPVFHGADKQMQLRTLVSGYNSLKQDLVRVKNRYKALFGRSAIATTGSDFYRDSSRISKLADSSQCFVARPLFEQIELLERQREDYKYKFEQNLKSFREMRIISSVPGFGSIFSNQIVGIVVSPFRFANKYKFFSYSSLIRHKWISDGTVYRNQRAYGNTQLKAIFKSATQIVLRGQNAFRRKYDQLRKNGSSDRAAANHITRDLAATVLAVWKSGKKYDDHYREVKEGNLRQSRAANLRTA
jgi:hypothetical protein